MKACNSIRQAVGGVHYLYRQHLCQIVLRSTFTKFESGIPRPQRPKGRRSKNRQDHFLFVRAFFGVFPFLQTSYPSSRTEPRQPTTKKERERSTDPGTTHTSKTQHKQNTTQAKHTHIQTQQLFRQFLSRSLSLSLTHFLQSHSTITTKPHISPITYQPVNVPSRPVPTQGNETKR